MMTLPTTIVNFITQFLLNPLQAHKKALQGTANFELLWSHFVGFSALVALCLLILLNLKPIGKIISPLMQTSSELKPLTNGKSGYEVFGFLPWWNINKTENIDFSTLTTLAYFGIPVDTAGNLTTDDLGYERFTSKKTTDLFNKAHSFHTRVVLTVTQMDNDTIETFLDSVPAQQNAITQIVSTVKARGIDGVNVDFEYSGSPYTYYRNQFSTFVTQLTQKMHQEVPDSRVTVSVYASAAKGQKIWDIAKLGNNSDGVFMMAYDFSGVSSDVAAPTAPLYGYKEGKYSYDISTAVEDFTKLMPANKLILGVPLYGYNYMVTTPKVNAQTLPASYWRGSASAQTYDYVSENITADAQGIDGFKTGWDSVGQVGWKAYHEAATNTWRMVFLDDARSLSIKYDFAKTKGLAGVGMWALGNDNNHAQDIWSVTKEKFGVKLADIRVGGEISE
jgi:spore germination protein YaaH